MLVVWMMCRLPCWNTVCSPTIDQLLTRIINLSLQNTYFPNIWNAAKGPLPKIASPKSLSDLCIVSILPVVSKIFEKKILHNQIGTFIQNENIILNSQCGFRKTFYTACFDCCTWQGGWSLDKGDAAILSDLVTTSL